MRNITKFCMCRPIEAAQTYHGVVLELSHLFLPEDKLISEHLVHAWHFLEPVDGHGVYHSYDCPRWSLSVT